MKLFFERQKKTLFQNISFILSTFFQTDQERKGVDGFMPGYKFPSLIFSRHFIRVFVAMFVFINQKLAHQSQLNFDAGPSKFQLVCFYTF